MERKHNRFFILFSWRIYFIGKSNLSYTRGSEFLLAHLDALMFTINICNEIIHCFITLSNRNNLLCSTGWLLVLSFNRILSILVAAPTCLAALLLVVQAKPKEQFYNTSPLANPFINCSYAWNGC